MPKLFTYIGHIFDRASKGSVLLTDRLTIMLVPFTTLTLWAGGAEMTESLQETLLLGVAMTVIAVVALRLVAASYFVWRDDQDEISDLHDKLESPLFQERQALVSYMVDLRRELSDVLARLVVLSAFICNPRTHPLMSQKDMASEFLVEWRRAEEIVTALSYDTALRISVSKFLEILNGALGIAREGSEKERNILSRKISRVKKLVFPLIHRKANNELLDLVTMLEVEIAHESNKLEPTEKEAKFLRELESDFAQIKEILSDPELGPQAKSKLERLHSDRR